MGNWSASKQLVMVHALYSADGSCGIDDKKCRRLFKYVDVEEYLSKYPKFKDMPNENSSKVSVDVRREIYGGSYGEMDIEETSVGRHDRQDWKLTKIGWNSRRKQFTPTVKMKLGR